MGMLQNITDSLAENLQSSDYRSAFRRGEDVSDYGASTGGELVNEDTAFNSSPFAAAIRLIANGGAKLPINLIDIRDGSTVQRDLAWLRKLPCHGMTQWAWKRSAITSLAIRGAAFLRIDRFHDNGLPDLMRPLPTRYIYSQPAHGSRAVKTRTDDGIHVYYNPNQQRTVQNDVVLKEWMYPGHDGNCLIIRFDDDGSLEGRNPVLASAGIIGVALAAQSNANYQFEGGGMPPGMIGLVDADIAEVEQAQARWKASRRRTDNRHTPSFTNRAVSWITMHMTAAEQQLIESRQFSVQEIARLYNIPLQLLGDPNTTWGTGVHEMVKVMHNSAIDPYTHCFASALSTTISNRHIYVEFDTSQVLYGDPKTRTELLTKAADGAYMTINEARERARLPAHPEGNIIRDKRSKKAEKDKDNDKQEPDPDED